MLPKKINILREISQIPNLENFGKKFQIFFWFFVFSPRKKNWLLVGWLHLGAKHPKDIFESDIMNSLYGQLEVCPDTHKDHYQVFVQFKLAVRHTAVRKHFPADGVWRVFYQKFGTADRMASYCTKEATRKPGAEPFQFGKELIIERKSTKLALAIVDLEKGHTIQQVALTHKECYVHNHVGLEKLYGRMQQGTHVPEFKLDSYTWPPITDWSYTHVFHGEAGIGKTEFALAHFKSPLIVRHIDNLRQFDRAVNDGIVFDDMDFEHLPKSTNINLIDQTLPGSIHIRYGTATIPAHTRKIFTTNNPGGLIFKDQGCKWWIDRRIHVTHLLGRGYRVASSSSNSSTSSKQTR